MSGAGQLLDHDWFPGRVPPNVSFGARSWCYSSFAFLHCRTERPVTIGADTGIYIGTMFDLGPGAEVRIGRFGTISGPVIVTDGRVTIGDYAMISWGVVLAGSATALPLAPGASGDIEIGDDCWIGANAIVLGPAVIGDGAVIGAAAVVTGAVPDHAIVAGNPGRVVGEARPR